MARPFIIFSPKIGDWVSLVDDPRQINKTDYKSSVLIWIGLFLFLLQLKASRNIDYKFGKQFLANFKGIFPLLGIEQHELNSIPHHGTVIDFFSQLSPTQLGLIRIEMIRRLIRMRVLEGSRLMGKYYLIAIDATQTITITEAEYHRNPEKYRHYLRKKISTDDWGSDHYLYYSYALEAKLVTPEGLAFSVLTEFVENENQDVAKQDCEIKAFYRLAERLREYFPKTNLCLLFDSLYAGKPTFDIIKNNHWTSIIRFKPGSMPNVYREFEALYLLEQDNRGQHVLPGNVEQSFRWVNDIDYQGHLLNVLECIETQTTKNGKEKATAFLWLCEQRITHNNFKQLSNKGGRCRWKIENQGFNAQKNEGYELEHAYSKDYNAIKCFYILLQIAHTINQLIIKGNLLKKIIKTFGSAKNFIEELRILFTRQFIDTSAILESIQRPFQIRIDSS